MSDSIPCDPTSQENPAAFLKNLVIPAIALHNPDLDWEEKITFSFLVCFMNSKGYCWWSNAKLAQVMKCSERTIRRRLETFEKMGWIKRVDVDGQRHIHDMTSMTPPVDKSLVIGAPPVTGVHPPGHGCPPPPDTGVHQIYIKEKNKEKDKCTPPVDIFCKTNYVEELTTDEKLKIGNIKIKPKLHNLLAGIVLKIPEVDSEGRDIRGTLRFLGSALKKLDADMGAFDCELVLTRLVEDVEHHNKLKAQGIRSNFWTVQAWLEDLGWKTDKYRQTPAQKPNVATQSTNSTYAHLDKPIEEREAEAAKCRAEAARRYAEEKKRGMNEQRMETRGEFSLCSLEMQQRERAIRWAHKLYAEDYGDVPKMAFCGELMVQMGYGNPLATTMEQVPLQGEKGMVKNLYVYCLERVKDEDKSKSSYFKKGSV
jgi:DNA-binding Lrp family transcriptional regulator